MFVSSILINYRKAFDTVNHGTPIKTNRGLALDWFNDYMTDRKQYVKFMIIIFIGE